jgi:hypothetical protein
MQKSYMSHKNRLILYCSCFDFFNTPKSTKFLCGDSVLFAVNQQTRALGNCVSNRYRQIVG